MTAPQKRSDASAKNAATEDYSAFGILFAVAGIVVLLVILKILSHSRRQQEIAAAQRLLEDQREAEWQRLVGLYGEAIAARIAARQVWQGMTDEQLIESWGSPADIAREIIRSKSKETWKYGQTGKNRFSNRVYLENGVVIGWKS